MSTPKSGLVSTASGFRLKPRVFRPGLLTRKTALPDFKGCEGNGELGAPSGDKGQWGMGNGELGAPSGDKGQWGQWVLSITNFLVAQYRYNRT
jgi:hypothetical protein